MKKYITLRPLTFYALVFCASLSLLSVFNVACQVSAKENNQPDEYDQLKTFTDVIALVRKNYYEDVDLKKLVNGAIKGMMLTLDPHSSYLDQDTYKDLKVETTGEFGGLGIEITLRDGILTVVSPIEDTPAARAGVQSGDQILKINDEFTKDISLNDAIKKMRGPKGTPVTISIHREGRKSLLPITIVRDIIKVKSVRYRTLENGFGYIRLNQFQEDSTTEFNKALEGLKKQLGKDGGIQGLVIDLRNNPGGLLTQAIRIADIFLDGGIVVYTDGRLEAQKQQYFARNDGNEPKYPIVVLINEGSASASEIVAGAFQDAGRVVTVGMQTFGKGSVQTIIPMEKGDALRLTTALYFTKSGRSIQAQGVTPDVKVEPKKEPEEKEETKGEMFIPKEKDLPGAIKNPNGTTTPTTEPKKEEKKEDSESKDDSKKDRKPLMGSEQAMKIDLQTLLSEDLQLAEGLKILKNWKETNTKPVFATSSSSSSTSSSSSAVPETLPEEVP